MLKGERNNILDPLHGQRQRVAREAFANHNLDAAKVVGGMPVILSKKLLAKAWEPQRLEVSVLRDTYGSSSAYAYHGHVYRRRGSSYRSCER
jgi:hypothetical protein